MLFVGLMHTSSILVMSLTHKANKLFTDHRAVNDCNACPWMGTTASFAISRCSSSYVVAVNYGALVAQRHY